MRVAAALLVLVTLAGVAAAAPRPRGRFSEFLDPALVRRRAPEPPPPPVFVAVLLACTEAATTQAWVRRKLVAAVGERVVAKLVIQTIIDCSAADEPDEVERWCEARHRAIRRDADVVIDGRCGMPPATSIARTIRERVRAR